LSCSGSTMITQHWLAIPSYMIKRMQTVVNSAARLKFSASRYDRIMPLLMLHCTSLRNSTSHPFLALTTLGCSVLSDCLLGQHACLAQKCVERDICMSRSTHFWLIQMIHVRHWYMNNRLAYVVFIYILYSVKYNVL